MWKMKLLQTLMKSKRLVETLERGATLAVKAPSLSNPGNGNPPLGCEEF